MTETNSGCCKKLTARRLTLLASVGALGAAVLLAGSNGRFWPSAVGSVSANAAELGTQRPVGFADIVAKVKPAVISVRVKVSGSGEPALLQDNRDDDDQQIPVQPGSPLNKFFQQFGDQFGQQFGRQFGPHAPRRHDTITGEAPASSSLQTVMRSPTTTWSITLHPSRSRPTTAQSTPQKWSALIPRPISP